MSGTKVAAPIFPTGSFPSVYESDLQGSYRSVQDIAERNSIPSERRKEGMVVFVIDVATYYQLLGGITNGDWQVWNPAGGAGSFVSLTHAAFDALYISASLTPGALYLLNDFQSYWNYGMVNYSGTVEPLLVIATSNATVSSRAYSTIFPTDIIVYDPETDVLNIKGKISYREDPKTNVKAYFDWRSIKIRRWETSSGNQEYLSSSDTTFASFDFYLVGSSGFIGGSPLNTTVLGFADSGTSYNIENGFGCTNNVIEDGSHTVTLKSNVTDSTLSICSDIEIDNSDNITIVYVGGTNSKIKVKSSSDCTLTGIDISLSFNTNVFANGTSIELGAYSNNITIGTLVSGSSFIKVGGDIDGLTVGDSCNRLTFSDRFKRLYPSLITVQSGIEDRTRTHTTSNFEHTFALNNPSIYSGTILTPDESILAGEWILDHNIPGTYLIDTISFGFSIPDYYKVRLRPANNIAVLINATPYISATSGDILIDNISGTITLNGSLGDWLELEYRQGIWHQTSAGGYY